NCQKACKKCDDARPCPRCVKYGINDTCVNSVRKERKKGIKRGPYKRRQKTKEDGVKKEDSDGPAHQPMRYPFGYPGSLNQYGQPYDPYNQYAYHKDQMMSQPYVVNPYPPMGYPVMVANGPNQPHPYPYMVPQAMPRPPMMHGEHYPGQVYYSPQPPQPHQPQQAQQAQPQQAQQDAVKSEPTQEFNKAQAMTTPVPSTTTSSTTSSPESAQ
ncbi:hypothetical protein CU098_005498, partial [Rhizopus stolonifer]